MILAITGDPRVGKSTLLLKLAYALKEMGINVYALIAREVRVNNARVGFEFMDLEGNAVRLASVNINGVRIGKYAVDLDGCSKAAILLKDAIKGEYRVIIFDEVGPMELASKDISDALIALLHSNKDMVVAIHKRMRHRIADMYRSNADRILEVTLENRDRLLEHIIDLLKIK